MMSEVERCLYCGEAPGSEDEIERLSIDNDCLGEMVCEQRAKYEAALTEGRSNDDLLATARADRQTLWDEVRALRELLSSIKWKSIDKDNMEFEARATCYFMDKVRNAVSGKQDKT